MEDNVFRSLEWRLIGPHRGGRVVAVAGHPTERATFYFGACAGGVWKTTNGGSHWENISDGFFATAAVGAIAVSEADPNVIYVGTGEATIRSNVSHGDGVYKSTDGGRTWRNVGLKDTRHIGDIVIHPKNPDIVYVAALGHAWGRNEERGVFRSKDGGATWERVLYKSDRAGAIDLALDTSNPRLLYASIWQAQRYPHAMHSGGEDSGLWQSTDGGDSWTEISRNKGLPEGMLGKIGVAASPAQAGRVWALIEAEEGKSGLYRSDDQGATWELVCDSGDLRRRPWYYMHVFADPNHADTVWVLNLGCWKSTDGGKTFLQIPTPHGDNHGLWIDPRDSNRLIEGNDGGGCVSYDGGRSWSSILNQPTAQFYHVTTDDQVPYHVYGSQQDNWAMRLPSISFEGAISWKDYVEPGGGESGHIAISPTPPHKVFGGGIGTGLGHGRLIAWNPETRQARNVTLWPELFGFGAGPIAMRYRFQWTFPVEFSPHDPDVLYICSNHVHRSTDEGTSWETISPDLTRNDPEKLQSSGGPLTADNSGAEIYCTIFAFRESPHEAGVFWAGTDDGLLHLSRDGGKNWQNVTPPDLPEWARITIIEPCPHDAAMCYIAATRYQLDDTRPYLYRTDDFGQSWTRITSGIPEDDFTRTIRADPQRHGLLYAGTETGVYVSFDNGVNWRRMRTNLPVVPIWDLVVKGDDLVAATHGRSFWILDDVSPLRQLQDGSLGDRLFKPRDTIRFRHYGRAYGSKTPGYITYKMTGPVTVSYRVGENEHGQPSEDFLDAGKNPPDGAIVHYHLAEKPGGPVTLRFLDADGNELRSFSSEGEDKPTIPAEPGANRFVWNLRAAAPTKLDDPPENDPFADTLEAGIPPRVVPGEYQVELKVGDQTYTERFTVLPDPRLSATAAQLEEQFALKAQLRDRLSGLHEAINQLRRIRKQAESWEERAKAGEGDGLSEELGAAATALKEKFGAIEEVLLQPEPGKQQPGLSRLRDQLVGLSMMIDESDDPPTQGAIEVAAKLGERLEEQQAKLRQLIAEDVRQFNETLRKAEVPAIAP